MSDAHDMAAELLLLRRQDHGAFGRLVQRHQGQVMGLCQSMGLSGADADDAAAEAFAAVYRALPGFEARSELTTWLYRIACRVILKVRSRRADRPAELPAERADPAQEAPDRIAAVAEQRSLLWRAVAELEPRQALAVELFYRRGLGLEEIGQILDCPVGTVKTLLFRAREVLRQSLARQEISP